jgi:hypothetical protein
VPAIHCTYPRTRNRSSELVALGDASTAIRVILIPHYIAEFVGRAVIGSIRRECLDHFLIRNEAHLRRLLRAYLAYDNAVRPHQALNNTCPGPRAVQPPLPGRVVATAQVGGLHHRYQRAA